MTLITRALFLAVMVGAAAWCVAAQTACADERKREDADRPVCIIKKPRPGYTADAREHSVSGTVAVNVQFLSDGTIGTVNWANTDAANADDLLKYGLVQKTIDAARNIEFLPEIKNRSPITATKLLSYSFAIY